MYLLIISAAIVVTLVVLLFLLRRKRKKHWQEGYILIGNVKSKEKPNENYPTHAPKLEENNDENIIMPPGMFD